MEHDPIKSMKLYARVDRIYDDLAHMGIGAGDPLTVEILTRFDQFHYFGTDAVDEAIRALGIDASTRVLDVGSGLGGPARYLAQHTGCHVTALELQGDLNAVAASLTERCGLGGRVEHRCGDVLDEALPEGGYDALVSWLAFYHIRDHARLFARCARALRSGGRLYAEDLFRRGEFDAAEQRVLTELLYGQRLALENEYVGALRAAGFGDIRFTDLTDAWRPHVVDRVPQYRAVREQNLAVHGAETVDALDRFYAAVARLFLSGKLCGARVTAQKP